MQNSTVLMSFCIQQGNEGRGLLQGAFLVREGAPGTEKGSDNGREFWKTKSVHKIAFAYCKNLCTCESLILEKNLKSSASYSSVINKLLNLEPFLLVYNNIMGDVFSALYLL